MAAKREVWPAAEAAEGKRAWVAAVYALDVGNLDEPPDTFWDEVPEEALDPSESMFDVDAQDELDARLTEERLQSFLATRSGRTSQG